MSYSSEEERRFRDQDLAFFGAVTAAVSHELNNAVAIIEQNSGLLEDMLLDLENGTPLDAGQVGKGAETIGRQALRQGAIVRGLNAFAHSTDSPERELKMGALLETVAAWNHRAAAQKRVSIETGPPAPGPLLRGDPFRVQQALFLALRGILEPAAEGGCLKLSAEEEGEAVHVRIEAGGTGASKETDFLETLMRRLGGALERVSEEGSVALRLSFPKRPRQEM